MKLLLMMYTQDFHFLHFSGFSAEVHETRLTSQVSASALQVISKNHQSKKDTKSKWCYLLLLVRGKRQQKVVLSKLGLSS